MPNLSIGRGIKSLRKAKDLTQAELANLWGVKINFISRVENDKKGVSLKNLERLAGLIRIPTSFIFILSDNPTEELINNLQAMVLNQIKK